MQLPCDNHVTGNVLADQCRIRAVQFFNLRTVNAFAWNLYVTKFADVFQAHAAFSGSSKSTNHQVDNLIFVWRKINHAAGWNSKHDRAEEDCWQVKASDVEPADVL